MINNNFIKISLIIGMLMSLLIVIICITYGVVTFFNYFSLVIVLIIIFGLFQLIPFLLCLNSYLNEEKWLFITGLISLMAFIIPGILILIGYFKRQKKLLKLVIDN